MLSTRPPTRKSGSLKASRQLSRAHSFSRLRREGATVGGPARSAPAWWVHCLLGLIPLFAVLIGRCGRGRGRGRRRGKGRDKQRKGKGKVEGQGEGEKEGRERRAREREKGEEELLRG